MSAPYLNRGESIVLTTHRITADSILYDVMLTNERLILMDRRYTRFEPRMVAFSAIITVKGGKASTGEPAIILTLKEPLDRTGPGQMDLIFSQEPGEERREERELWVRKLIELVITARERAVQGGSTPKKKKTGMQPLVRRWVAPEPPRPHAAVIDPASAEPRMVTVVSEEPDALEFFLEARSAGPTAPEETGSSSVPSGSAEGRPEEPAATSPRQRPEIVPEPSAGLERSPPVSSPGPSPDVLPEPPAAVTKDHPESFASTVLAATQSLKARADANEERPPEESREPGREEGSGAVWETPEDLPGTAAGRGVIRTTPLPERRIAVSSPTTPFPRAQSETPKAPPAGTPEGSGASIPSGHGDQSVAGTSPLPDRNPSVPAAEPSGLPAGNDSGKKRPGAGGREARGRGIPAPSGDAAAIALPAEETGMPGLGKGGRTVLIVIIAIVGIILLIGGMILAGNFLKTPDTSRTTVPVPPTATLTPVPVSAVTTLSPKGVSVEVSYAGLFTGTVGNPGSLRPVSGTGNRTFPILMTSVIVQATIQKQDYSGDALSVRIYDNSTLLAERTVTAPMGEINLLIDTKTASPPGIGPDSTGGRQTILLGNGTLIYY